MSDLTPPEEALKALRAEIRGDLRPFGEIAAALNCTVRTIYNVVARHRIPVVKIANVPHARPADFRRALIGDPQYAAPRRRGRPRKLLVRTANIYT